MRFFVVVKSGAKNDAELVLRTVPAAPRERETTAHTERVAISYDTLLCAHVPSLLFLLPLRIFFLHFFLFFLSFVLICPASRSTPDAGGGIVHDESGGVGGWGNPYTVY